MGQLIVGVDLDGVLANFNDAFRRKLAEVTGRALIPEGEEPPCWFYATEHYGYTKEEDKATWKAIIESKRFWYDLAPYPGTADFLYSLSFISGEVYFITTRPGDQVKQQSERWIEDFGAYLAPKATVLIARGDKGQLAQGLKLTHFIDDRPENCFSVRESSPGTEVFMLAARYNQWALDKCAELGIIVIPTIHEFSQELHDAA